MALEWSVNRRATALGVSPADLARLAKYLDQLRDHHESTYVHSLRVGLLAADLAPEADYATAGLLLLSGCAHDVGKLKLLRRSLNAKRLKPDGPQRMQVHARFGFELLQTDLPEIAIVAGLHHRFGENGFGLDLDADAPVWLSLATRKRLEEAARLVMLADFYDDLRARGVGEPGQQLMVDRFPGYQVQIGQLFHAHH